MKIKKTILAGLVLFSGLQMLHLWLNRSPDKPDKFAIKQGQPLLFGAKILSGTSDSNRAKKASDLPSMRTEDLLQAYQPLLMIKAKPFPTEEEKRLLRDAFSNRTLISETVGLLKSNEGFFDASKEGAFRSVRIEAVEFLVQSLNWRENPLRSDIISEIEKIVVSPVSVNSLSVEQKKQLAGDKIELFSVLLQASPERAQFILRQAEGTPQERLLRFSMIFTQDLQKRRHG